jgi:hypothetical protein
MTLIGSKMVTTSNLLDLVLGIGFAFFLPVFFSSAAEWKASLGYPEFKRFLPKLFKIAFWAYLIASIVFLAALSFQKEERAEIAVGAVISATLAWRCRRALK